MYPLTPKVWAAAYRQQ